MTYEISAHVRQSMRDSLKNLMKQKALDEISIGQVMNACGMCRQHFYYYYANIYSLVEDIFESDEADLFRQQEKADSWQNQLFLLLQYAEKNRDFCLCTMNSLGGNILTVF